MVSVCWFCIAFLCLSMSNLMKLLSGSASAGFLHHNGGKSWSVSNVMFHLMCVMLGRKLIFWGKKNLFHFGQRFSDVLKCCIWLLFAYGGWNVSVEVLMLPQLSDVYCCLIFMVFLIKHTDFMAKNLLVVTFFTWDTRCTKWNQTVLKKVFLSPVRAVMSFTPHQKSRMAWCE